MCIRDRRCRMSSKMQPDETFRNTWIQPLAWSTAETQLQDIARPSPPAQPLTYSKPCSTVPNPEKAVPTVVVAEHITELSNRPPINSTSVLSRTDGQEKSFVMSCGAARVGIWNNDRVHKVHGHDLV